MSGVEIQKPTSARPAIGYKLQNNPFFANRHQENEEPKASDIKKSQSSVVGRQTNNILDQSKNASTPSQTKLAKAGLAARTTDDLTARRPSLRKVNAVTNNPWKEKLDGRGPPSSKLSTSVSATVSSTARSPYKTGEPRSQETGSISPKTTTAKPTASTTTKAAATTASTATTKTTTLPSSTKYSESKPILTETAKTSAPIVQSSSAAPTKPKQRTSVSTKAYITEGPRSPLLSTPATTQSPSPTPSNRDVEEHVDDRGSRKKEPSNLAEPSSSWLQDKSTAGTEDTQPVPAKEILDLDEMIHQITITHAIQSAVHFPILTLEEADELKKEQEHAQATVKDVRNRIKMESYVQRTMASLLRISDISQGETATSWRTSSTKLDALVDELMDTFSASMDVQLNWLQHLAGTLAVAIQRGGLSRDCAPRTNHERLSATSGMLDQLLSRLDSVARRHTATTKKTAGGRIGSVSDDGSLSDDSVFSKSVRTSVTSLDSGAAQHQQQNKLVMGNSLIDAIEKQLAENERQTSPKTIHTEANLQAKLEKEMQRRENLEARAYQEQRETDQLRKALDSETRQRQALESALAVLREEQAGQGQRETEQLRKALDRETRKRQEVESALAALREQKAGQEQHETEQLHKALDREARKRKELESALTTLQEEKTEEKQRWHRERQENERLYTQVQSEQRQRQTEKDAILDQSSSVLAHRPSTVIDAVQQLVHTIQSRPKKQADNGNQSGLEEELTRQKALLEKQQARLDAAQEEFTQRESAYLLQSASTEAELAQVLKEYDRLTRSINDSSVERKKYEQRVLELSRENSRLDKTLADEKIKGLGQDGQSLTLRKEFRQLMANTKVEHQQALEREMKAKQAVEQELRETKRDVEMKLWDRVDKSIQTSFCV